MHSTKLNRTIGRNTYLVIWPGPTGQKRMLLLIVSVLVLFWEAMVKSAASAAPLAGFGSRDQGKQDLEGFESIAFH